jgi:hypothetical protein
MAEDQLIPKSPMASLSNEQRQLGQDDKMERNASRRIRPGTKSIDIPEGPPVVDISEVCSSIDSCMITAILIKPID